MKHINKFENFNQLGDDNITYYSCDECDSLWKDFNDGVKKCKFCESSDIEDLSKDEWIDVLNIKVSEDGNEIDLEEISKDDFYLNLYEDK